MRVCVALLILVGAMCQQDPLLPPLQRLERSLALPPSPRKAPLPGHEFEPRPSPSESPIVRPVPIDLSIATIGNELSHRQYLDYPEGLQIAVPCLKFPGSGFVHKWEVYAGRDCELELQVLRPVPIPEVLSENKHTVHNYKVIGSNIVKIPGLGKHTFEISDNRIAVQPDDVIGWHTSNPGCISWSPGGPPVLFRTSIPGHNEEHVMGGMVFIGDGAERTYSISCTGNFVENQAHVESRVSPSSSPRPSPSSFASRSASTSPSGTVSVTPMPTPSNSIGATPSMSYTSTESLSPSPSPTMFGSTTECAHGVYFWCATEENMRMCNVTKEVCQAIMDAINPVLPSTLPSVTPAPSTTPSLTPTLTPGLQPRLPSPTPSMSLEPPPYEEYFSAEKLEEHEGTGLSPCHYCNGGSDWTGGQCATGQEQSPVTVNFENVEVDAAMDLYVASNYNQTWATLAWNNYAFTISSPYLGRVNIDAVNYHADMAVVRAPSEHKISGLKTPMELQIFHHVLGSNPPRVLAIAVLFEETAEPVPGLDWIFGISEDHNPQQIVVRFEDYFTDMRPLVFYNGSMTQPPCSEGITWGVSMGTAKVSSLQLKKLNSFLKGDIGFAKGRGNNRHPQPLNGRKLVMRSNCGISGSLTCERAKASAANVPASQGGSAERAEAAVKEDVMTRLAVAPAPTPVLEPPMPEKDLGDDALFGDDDGVKLW
eukprot:c60_g1_i1.p1 GENE.c60_g1_i1~~c60_g1_i1.p1  ORF type:complete len:708 (-),score=100.93 c60_g1_i1:49-2172(-)